jgi:hypothetical protein
MKRNETKRNETETKRKRNGNEMETKWKRNGNEMETKWKRNGNEMKRNETKYLVQRLELHLELVQQMHLVLHGQRELLGLRQEVVALLLHLLHASVQLTLADAPHALVLVKPHL